MVLWSCAHHNAAAVFAAELRICSRSSKRGCARHVLLSCNLQAKVQRNTPRYEAYEKGRRRIVLESEKTLPAIDSFFRWLEAFSHGKRAISPSPRGKISCNCQSGICLTKSADVLPDNGPHRYSRPGVAFIPLAAGPEFLSWLRRLDGGGAQERQTSCQCS